MHKSRLSFNFNNIFRESFKYKYDYVLYILFFLVPNTGNLIKVTVQ